MTSLLNDFVTPVLDATLGPVDNGTKSAPDNVSCSCRALVATAVGSVAYHAFLHQLLVVLSAAKVRNVVLVELDLHWIHLREFRLVHVTKH